MNSVPGIRDERLADICVEEVAKDRKVDSQEDCRQCEELQELPRIETRAGTRECRR